MAKRGFKGEIPHHVEFYSIEEGQVHISAYMWYDDEVWHLTEFTFCLIPIDEFVGEYALRGMEFVDDCEGEVQQYEDEISYEEAVDIYQNYSEGATILNYSDITEDTLEGNYKTGLLYE